MKQKTIVYANTIDFDQPLQQRPHHLMKYFSENGYMVYWVNYTQRTDKVRDRISDTLEVYHNWEVFLKRNPKVDIYFSSWAMRHMDLESIEADLVIYDSLDNFPENEHEEVNMISKADILLAASKPLLELRSKQHKNVHLVRNACFNELGDLDYPIPEDLTPFNKRNKPIVLFSGALTSNWCDLLLMEKIAKKYQVLVVGLPWGIKEMPKGVHYLGSKGYQELQAYYHHADVTLLPFQRCQISDFSNPLKVYESLAHGTPVVATDIPEMDDYKDVVFVSRNHKEFIKNIHKAIKVSKCNDYKNKAKEMAKYNSWDDRFEIINGAIKEFFKGEKDEKSSTFDNAIL
ncbi:UNVERIFIED_CONTAM: glycosyltransferase involved in cell wall biosynthesis [Paenibacillus sp. PvR008]